MMERNRAKVTQFLSIIILETGIDNLATCDIIDAAQKGECYMSKELGRRIAEVLKRNGQTQKDLAERLSVSEAVISRYVSGERDPKPDMLANIATAIHTTSDYLLGIENEEFSHPKVRRLIARNAANMTEQEKKELINALFGEG